MVGVGDNVFTFFVAQLNLGDEEVLQHLLHAGHVGTRGGAESYNSSESTCSVYINKTLVGFVPIALT